MRKTGISLITLTGDRQWAFRLTEQWMTKQTISYDQWIVIDDGRKPSHTTLHQEYYRLPPMDEISIHRNLLFALDKVKHSKIIIIEDDDYYKEGHLEEVSGWLDNYNLVGQAKSIYYNVKYRWYRINKNVTHASLCQTGFKKSAVPALKRSCSEAKYIDHRFWENFKGKKKVFIQDSYNCIGIKGLPGRSGIAEGHGERQTNDPNAEYLKQLIGEDWKIYENLLEKGIEIKGVKVNGNGDYWLPKKNKKLESVLDKLHNRVHNELLWRPKAIASIAKVHELKDKYTDSLAYMIGKGPSLDRLTEKDFKIKDAPIICLNESIHKIEELDIPNPLYTIQQDAKLKETCWSKKGAMVISYLTQSWYHEHPNVYDYSPKDFGLSNTKHPISGAMGVYFAKFIGIKEMKLLAFDSMNNDPELSYAESIGYMSTEGGDPSRFYRHAKEIQKALKLNGICLVR